MMKKVQHVLGNRAVRLGARVLAALGMVALGAVLAASGATAGKYSERYAKASSLLVDRGNAALDKQPDAAKAYYEQAIVANPRNAKAFSALGIYYMRQSNNQLAGKYFTIALDIDEDQPQALSFGGKVDLKEGNLKSAEAKLFRLRTKCATCAEYKALNDAIATFKASKKSH